MTRPPRSASDLNWADHLEDLRRRLIRIVIVFVVASVLVYPSAGAFLSWLTAPAGQLVFLSPADAFMAFCCVTLWGGFLASSPYIFFQAWGFIAEGLQPQERRLAIMFGALSFILFIAGAFFAYSVIVPMTYRFFLSFATSTYVPMITLDRYLSFVIATVLSFAVAFELPIVLLVLAHLGLVKPEALVAGRRYAVVIILIVAAVLTPPDIVSQLLLAVPMIILYEAGILCVRWARKKEK